MAVKIKLKVFLIILFSLGILAFLLPAFVSKLNIGNIFGILFFTVLLLITIFHKYVFSAVKAIWGNSFGRFILILLGIILVLLVILAITLSALMISKANSPPKTQSTVIVLGCRVKGEKPSLMLKNRTMAAYKYLEKNPDIMCIVSGGQGEGEDISEAECMKKILTSKGINENRIFMENKSTNTEENIDNSMKIIKNNGFSENITIVTSEYHQYRAYLIAKNYSNNVYSISSSTNIFYLPVCWVREWLGICYNIVFK